MAISKRQRKPMNVSPVAPASWPPFLVAPFPVVIKQSQDQMLREAGFQIVSRPATGEPLWRRKLGAHWGRIMPQSDAVDWAILDRRRKAAVDEEYAT